VVIGKLGTICFPCRLNYLSVSGSTVLYCQWTCCTCKYSPPLILCYIFHIKPHFSKNYCEVISKRILIIFAPEEAEIFKRLFVYFSTNFCQITFIFLWFKDNFLFSDVKFAIYLTKIKSEKSIFVFKSPENKNHADKNYYQIKIQRILRVLK
jgi:hypothetical protein